MKLIERNIYLDRIKSKKGTPDIKIILYLQYGAFVRKYTHLLQIRDEYAHLLAPVWDVRNCAILSSILQFENELINNASVAHGLKSIF